MATLPARPQIASTAARHVYDVAVLGGQLGGALAAALLAKRGHRVLWVEHDGLGAGYVHGGFLLPYAPFLSAPPRSFPAVEDALIELGLAEYIKRAIRPQTLQIVLPRHRFDLPLEDAQRMAELTREWGDDAAALESRWKASLAQHATTNLFFRHPDSIPPVSFWERWSSRRKVASTPALAQAFSLAGDSETEQLVRGLARFVGYLAQPAPLTQTRTLSQVLSLPGRYLGAREGLRDMLCKRVTELGGVFMGRDTSTPSALVESLTFEGQRITGLRLHGSETEYRAASIVAATDAAALRRLIPEKRRQRKLTELLDTMSTPSFLFSVNWVMPQDAMPMGIGELILMATEDPELNPMLVQVMPARNESGKDEPGLVNICAGAFISSSTRELGEDHLNKLADRMSAELSRLIPFSEGHRKDVSAPYLHAGGVRGSRLMPHPLYTVEGDSYLGVTGLPAHGPVRNLFFGSREVIPGLGVEGELLAGIQAAREVQKLLHKKRALPR